MQFAQVGSKSLKISIFYEDLTGAYEAIFNFSFDFRLEISKETMVIHVKYG